MKFKVGDKVRVVKTRTDIKKKYIGKEYKIAYINPNGRLVSEEHYSLGQSWVFFSDELELVTENKIDITVNGNETIAKLYDGKKVVKTASAKCSPSDEFDFTTGAKLAFDRLINEPKEKFVPHLESETDAEHYGNIGEPTNCKDAVGRPLCVGDVVELYYKGEYKNVTPIVRTTVRGKEKTFVMGIELTCNEETGFIIDDWKILKKRSYKDIKNGEEVDYIKYITKEG